jgi:hypothetical protein
LRSLAGKSLPLAKKLAANAVRPRLEKIIKHEGLEWADVAPVISIAENLGVADIENQVVLSSLVRHLTVKTEEGFY